MMDYTSASASQPQFQGLLTTRRLGVLDPAQAHKFVRPVKRIHESHDVPLFLTSAAYRDIGIFVMQLNRSMCPKKSPKTSRIEISQLDQPLNVSEPVLRLQELLQRIDGFIDEVPPDNGPRRFGNVSFRKWYEITESRVQALLQDYLPQEVLNFSITTEHSVSVLDELTPYLMGGFGSHQRLDYGTGHELSFLAFVGCIWKLGGFGQVQYENGALERSIVIRVIEPYLKVIRRLIMTYTLEPAGSHGVWGLDDHSFLPYIFGSSQYCPAISDDDPMPVEGSFANAPNPADVAKKVVVDQERKHNMYFAAIGFINDVKTGPFWEHSPILFDVSGIRSGWGKINKGMIKMYNAEVLSKFPVVQHFPFGSLFSWDQDTAAERPATTQHTANRPASRAIINAGVPNVRLAQATKAPWPQAPTTTPLDPVTQAQHKPGNAPTRAPGARAA